jgi:hypothetical protein
VVTVVVVAPAVVVDVVVVLEVVVVVLVVVVVGAVVVVNVFGGGGGGGGGRGMRTFVHAKQSIQACHTHLINHWWPFEPHHFKHWRSGYVTVEVVTFVTGIRGVVVVVVVVVQLALSGVESTVKKTLRQSRKQTLVDRLSVTKDGVVSGLISVPICTNSAKLINVSPSKSESLTSHQISRKVVFLRLIRSSSVSS